MNTALQFLVNHTTTLLKDKGIDACAFEIKLLLAHLLNIEPSEIYNYDKALTETQKKDFQQMIALREQHYPVDKIIGHKGFYKYEFEVTADVLSPRQDTEVLVEKALHLLSPCVQPRLLEFGIGSGCILLSLLADKQDAFGYGIDISDKALEVALRNAKNLDVLSRLKLINVSWFSPEIIQHPSLSDLDMIVSNPPYIKTKDIDNLDPEVKNFDPLIALDGGNDGLRDYRKISELSSLMLKKDGLLLFEIGEGQENDVVSIAKKYGFHFKETVKDLNQTNRCIIFKK